jgi:hypothetical protein
MAVTCNARAGPGIVLASGAFDAGILNASFFTTLMVTPVVISGLWFRHGFVLCKGWSLLKAEGPVHNTVSPRPSWPRAITTGSTSGPSCTPSDRT